MIGGSHLVVTCRGCDGWRLAADASAAEAGFCQRATVRRSRTAADTQCGQTTTA